MAFFSRFGSSVSSGTPPRLKTIALDAIHSFDPRLDQRGRSVTLSSLSVRNRAWQGVAQANQPESSHRFVSEFADQVADQVADRAGNRSAQVHRRSRGFGKMSGAILRLGKRIKGTLAGSDRYRATLSSYIDEYRLKPAKPGRLVEVNLRSSAFNPYLELLNARTRRVLLSGDDIGINNSNARLVFTAKPNTQYVVRVSRSLERPIGYKTGNYVLRSRVLPASPADFNFFYGYGLANAAAAVAQAKGQALFADVPDLGGNDWRLDAINAPEVWAQGITGQGVTVAVIDGGIDYNHPDLSHNLWKNPGEIPNNGIDDDGNGFIDDVHGWDFVHNDNTPLNQPGDDHGTHVAGIIAAAKNNIGTTGVAYNAKIMPIQVLGNQGGSDSQIAQGIRYAIANGAKVINMSLGKEPGVGITSDLMGALQQAQQAGVVVVIASGNDRESLSAVRPDDPAYSAAIANLGIAVGAIDSQRTLDLDSSPAGRNRLNFLVAPGVNIYSTIPVTDAANPASGYGFESGTSMAAPHIAGIAALMLSANPNLTPAQVSSLLLTTANRQGLLVSP
jgi:hypothetical protein